VELITEPSKADLALIGKVSRLSKKKVIAYAWDFLTDWLKQAVDEEDNKNPIDDWDAKIASQPSWTGATTSATSSLPSYKSKSLYGVEGLEAPGQGWIRNPQSKCLGQPFLIQHHGLSIQAPWVKYDFSPAQPQLLASLGKDYPIEARPLRPYKIADTDVTYTVTQMQMFDTEEPVTPRIDEAIETKDDPLLQAGICQYRYFLSQERNSEEQLR
jgi:hypothetical protein